LQSFDFAKYLGILSFYVADNLKILGYCNNAKPFSIVAYMGFLLKYLGILALTRFLTLQKNKFKFEHNLIQDHKSITKVEYFSHKNE